MEDVSGRGVYLSVIIPAYNEENRLPATLKEVTGWLGKQSFSWEVAVVNDGSKDKTAEVVKEVMVHESRVRLLEYGGNRGKGYAVKYGMTHVSGQFRLFMDADNATTVDQVASFLSYSAMGFDVVIGSRDVPGADIAVHQPWWKEKLGDLGNLWIQFWAVLGIKDTQAGFKLFTARAADDVFPVLTLDRWGFDVEALAVARLKGYKIMERPIRWVNDPDSRVSIKAYIEVLQEVVKVRMNIWQGRYSKSSSVK